jgi:transposase-like protein
MKCAKCGNEMVLKKSSFNRISFEAFVCPVCHKGIDLKKKGMPEK